jgi:hypothetical protein
MRIHPGRRIGAALIMLFAVVLLGWRPAGRDGAAPDRETVGCDFVIRGSNNLNNDVYVYLYDSKVRTEGTGVFTFWKQLKIQNHRIAPGKLMDRRYTTDLKCSLNRQWYIEVKRGSTRGHLLLETGGTASDSRTVDLGRASGWQIR